MGKVKAYKCNYTYCFCDYELNIDVQHAIHNNKHYHTECFKQKQDKEEIRKLYLEKINPKEVISSLNGVIQNIIHKKNISSDFLLFALKYCITNNIKIKYPAGLHYIVSDIKMKERYNAYVLDIKCKKIKEDIQNANNRNDKSAIDNDEDFEYKSKKPKWLI